MKNINDKRDFSNHICNKYVLTFRNPNNYSYFYTNKGIYILVLYFKYFTYYQYLNNI